MSQHTCTVCGMSIHRADNARGRKPKYCSPKCSRKAHRAKAKPNAILCTLDGCGRPHKARGLCSTHYNQKHQPDRHDKVEMPCAWCGKMVLKHKSNSTKRKPVCSEQCRSNIAWPPKCDLPEDHWALWINKASAWPRLPLKQCMHCDEMFAPSRTANTYCSRTCSAKASWVRQVHASGGKTHEEWLAIDRTCIDCDSTYTSPYAGEARCTPCGTIARRRAGTWITTARRQRLYARDSYVCHLCGNTTDPNADPTEPNFPSLDHLLPRSKGGGDEDSNLATACMECNWIRSDDDLDRVGSLTLA